MNLKQDSELEHLFELCRQQLSDLVFFDDELKFFKNLLDKYFHTMLTNEDINRVQLINNQLKQLSMVKANITRDVLIHQGNLQSKIKALLPKSIDFLKLENSRMDDEVKNLNKYLKKIKREIFTIYKDISTADLVKHQNNSIPNT